MIEDHIASVNLKSNLEAIGDSGQKYSADSIIISTGVTRWLNLKLSKNLEDLEFQHVLLVMVSFLKIKKLQL